MSSAHNSPEAKSNKDSPLSLLASIISNSPNNDQTVSVETKVKCISLGTYQVGNQIHSFQLFVFPNGNFFSLEQLNGLFFKESRASILAHLQQRAPKPGMCRDITTKSIYLSTEVTHEIGQELNYPHLAALALFARDNQLSHQSSYLAKIEGLSPLQKSEELNLILSIGAYVPERKRSAAKRPTSSEDDKVKTKNKRLSIDTRFSEKLESNTALLEQMKSSYMMKQKQQAIIDMRTKSAVGSAHPDNSIQSAIPRTQKKVLSRELLNGIDQIVSPRAEFPNRELPRPRGFEGNGAPPSAHPLSMNHIPSPPGPESPPSAQKAQFLSLCEQLYDNNEATTKLQHQLKEQIRKSATLLYTLSSSGQMIEGLVRTHFREMQGQYGEKFGAALTDLNRRLVSLEHKMLGGATQSEAFSSSGALMSALPKENGHTIPSIVERLEHAAKDSGTEE